jgi:hypothetical protein
VCFGVLGAHFLLSLRLENSESANSGRNVLPVLTVRFSIFLNTYGDKIWFIYDKLYLINMSFAK